MNMRTVTVRPGDGRRRWWTLGALTLALVAVGMDATVLSVALPTLAGALHAGTSGMQWFFSAYTLALAVALLPGGLAGDRYGRRKVMLAALATFGLGSAACAYAPSAGAFIAARTVLGLSAGVLVPVSLSVLVVTFPEGERPKAVGAWAAASFLALPAGPILGGWLLSSYWWGWVFLMNVPVVAAGLAAVALWVPESRAAERPGLDMAGIAASCTGLALLAYGFIAAGQDGWASAAAMTALAVGAVLLTGFVAWERRLAHAGGQPLVDLALFRSRRFTWGTLLSAAGVFAMFGLLFAAPQYFQAVGGADAMGSGVRLLPMMAGLVAGAALADRIAARVGTRITTAAGFVALAAGLAAGATMTAASGGAFVSGWTAASGLGFGLALATAASAALADLPAGRAGVGSGVMQAVQKTGAPLATAILGSVLSTTYQAHLHLGGLPAQAAAQARRSVFAGLAVAARLGRPSLTGEVRAAFVSGTDALLWVSAALALAGTAAALAFLPRRAPAAAAVGTTGGSTTTEAGRQGAPRAGAGENHPHEHTA